MKFEIDKCPYDERELFTKTNLELQPNTISCFVGCNGTGKTTLIDYIKHSLEKKHAKELKNSIFPDLEHAFKSLNGDEEDKNKDKLFFVDFSKHTKNADSQLDSFLVDYSVSFSSTGEGISYRLGKTLEVLGKGVSKLKNTGSTLFVFFDDCDAGTSLDKIIEIKDVMKMIAEHCSEFNITYYIVLTANSYEMCRDIDCISVHDFKHLAFNDYEDYKKFVLESAALKGKSYGEE